LKTTFGRIDGGVHRCGGVEERTEEIAGGGEGEQGLELHLHRLRRFDKR